MINEKKVGQSHKTQLDLQRSAFVLSLLIFLMTPQILKKLFLSKLVYLKKFVI